LTYADALTVLEGGPLMGQNHVVLGDITGPAGTPDGIPEVVASSGLYGPVWAGVYSGADVAAGGSLGTGSLTAMITIDTLLGGGVAAGGVDITGDGLPDLALGGGTCLNDPPSVGYAFLMDGALLSSGAILDPTVEHQVSGGACLGATVGLMPDLDGDGYGTMLVADPSDNNNTGVVYAIAPADLDQDAATAASFVVDGSGSSGQLRVERRVADHDGDGLPDLMVGAPGVLDTFQALNGAVPNGNGGVYWFPADLVSAGGTVTPADAQATFIHRGQGVGFGISFDVGPVNPDDALGDVYVSASSQGAGNAFVFLSGL